MSYQYFLLNAKLVFSVGGRVLNISKQRNNMAKRNKREWRQYFEYLRRIQNSA